MYHYITKRMAALKAERNHKFVIAAISFTFGLLIGMAAQSFLSLHMDAKAAEAAHNMYSATGR